MEETFKIPKNVSCATVTLIGGGFDAYLVGGCVRDLLLGRKPKDWDITTNATPEQIQKLFAKTVYENDFGTVAVVFEDSESSDIDKTTRVVEITPYRLESKYSDKRHPDKICFAKNIGEDLRRRDFTVNAMAMNSFGETTDLFNGKNDLKNKIIRAVGDANERLQEDALRIMRAIRLATELDFDIEKVTRETLQRNAHLLGNISKERIKDEFIKIIMSDTPSIGIKLMDELGVLPYIIPELAIMQGVDQNKSHIYDVWEHSLRALDHAACEGYSFEVRIGVLLHDIGKPKSRRFDKSQNDYTFYGHDVVGARITKNILKNLKFPAKQIEVIVKLVRNHMFFADPEKITLSAVRRIIARVGEENVWNLMKVRISDRIGMGRPKAEPYRLRKYESMVEEALRDPISVGQLAVDGKIIMSTLGIKQGPQIGYILHALLEEVLDDPSLNTIEYLTKRAKELIKLPGNELKVAGEKGKDKKGKEEEKELKKLRDKYHVQ